MTNSITPIETTGRYLVLLPEADVNSGINALTDATGIRAVARAADFDRHTFTAEQLESADAKVFDTLGVAVVSLDPDQVQSIRSAVASERAVLAVEPERVVYAIGSNLNIDSERVNSLYQIEGVQQVESERSYQLPPPESDIQ